MKIMIVDDHADTRRLIMSVVSYSITENIDFIECESGEAAIMHYQNVNPDWVLMDIELKSMSGFEVASAIRRQNALAKVVIVTSYDTATFRKKAEKMHMLGFVPKDNLAVLPQIINTITI